MATDRDRQYVSDLVHISGGAPHGFSDYLAFGLVFAMNAMTYSPERAREMVAICERCIAEESGPITIRAIPLEIIESYARAGEKGLAQVKK